MAKLDEEQSNYFKELEKWQEETLKEIKKLSNEDLLTTTFNLARGDDWEGEFTVKGLMHYNLLKDELIIRLQSIGFVHEFYKLL